MLLKFEKNTSCTYFFFLLFLSTFSFSHSFGNNVNPYKKAEMSYKLSRASNRGKGNNPTNSIPNINWVVKPYEHTGGWLQRILTDLFSSVNKLWHKHPYLEILLKKETENQINELQTNRSLFCRNTLHNIRTFSVTSK